MTETRWAQRGDTIKSTLSNGQILRVQLETPEATAYANQLIAAGRWTVDDEMKATEASR